MSTTLLDLNVLMALAWPSHEHHRAARKWFLGRGNDEYWATCPFTQVGFVRLSSNPVIVDPPATPKRAAELLRRLAKHPGHVFWTDDLDVQNDDWPEAWVRGHRQITDAHLVRVAERHQGAVATFDSALASCAKNVVVVGA